MKVSVNFFEIFYKIEISPGVYYLGLPFEVKWTHLIEK